MTNGEKIKAIFPNAQIDEGMLEMYVWLDHEPAQFTKNWWNSEYREPNTTIDYYRAFKIACELLNGSVLYGIDADRIYEIMMDKDGVVSSDSYESYILNNLQELDKGQYASEPTTKNNLGVNCTPHFISFKEMMDNLKITAEDIENAEDLEYSIEPLIFPKNDLGVDCIDRQATLDEIIKRLGIKNESYLLPAEKTIYQQIKDMPSVTPQEPRWIPVSERLPDKGYSILVMRITDDNYKYMRVATYQGDCWMDDTDKFNKPNPHKVIAWMPLPSSYERGEKV